MTPKTYCEVKTQDPRPGALLRGGRGHALPGPGCGTLVVGRGLWPGKKLTVGGGGGECGDRGSFAHLSALWAPRPGSQGQSPAGWEGKLRARTGRDRESLPRPAPLPRGPGRKSRAPGYKSRLWRVSHLGLGARHGFRRAVPRACPERTPSRSSRPERRSESVVPAAPLGPAPWAVPWDRGGSVVAHLQLALARKARLWRSGQQQVALPAAGASREHIRPFPSAHTGRSRVPPAPAPGVPGPAPGAGGTRGTRLESRAPVAGPLSSRGRAILIPEPLDDREALRPTAT